MSTDWNLRKQRYNGPILIWNEKDDIQRLLTVFQDDIVGALNSFLEYGYVLEFTQEHKSFVNNSPLFWGEVLVSLRFSLIMKTARIFDRSNKSMGLNKVFNVLEQSKYRDVLMEEIKKAKEQYNEYCEYLEEIKTIRDKYYAHNDSITYRFWESQTQQMIEFEGEFWGKIEEILIWVRDTVLLFREIIGDGYPVNNEITNDLEGLLSYRS